MPSRPTVFQFGIFLVLFWVNKGVLLLSGLLPALAAFLSYCLSIQLFHYDLYVPIFCSKIVVLPLHSVVVMSSHHFPDFLVEFSFVVLFFLYCLMQSMYLFSLSSFARIFWSVSSSCIVCTYYVALLFSFPKILAFFFCLNIFACRWSFLICVSSLISLLASDYLCFWRTPIFSQTNFVPA